MPLFLFVFFRFSWSLNDFLKMLMFIVYIDVLFKKVFLGSDGFAHRFLQQTDVLESSFRLRSETPWSPRSNNSRYRWAWLGNMAKWVNSWVF